MEPQPSLSDNLICDSH